MGQILRLLVVLLSVCALACGQRSNGYFFVAPGGVSVAGNTSASVHLGGGGEAVLGKGVGLGAEIGALGPARDFSELFGVLSPNLYYHFSREYGGRLDPFVTAGYTLFFRSGTANLFNFGGGAGYWFSDRIGIRIEFRDHLRTEGRVTVHYWGIRLGISFR